MKKPERILVGKIIKSIHSITETEKSRKESFQDKIELDIQTGDYDDEGGETVIEFTDGTYITIWASEWGGICYRTSKQKRNIL